MVSRGVEGAADGATSIAAEAVDDNADDDDVVGVGPDVIAGVMWGSIK